MGRIGSEVRVRASLKKIPRRAASSYDSEKGFTTWGGGFCPGGFDLLLGDWTLQHAGN